MKIDFTSPKWRVLILVNRVMGALGLIAAALIGWFMYVMWDMP